MITFQSASSSKSLVPIDLQGLFWKSKTLPKDIVSITGFQQSIGGKTPAIEKNSSGKILGDRNKKIKRVDVRFKFKGFASVRETSITLSGSVPWEMIYRVLVRLVPDAKTLTFTVTNTAVRFYLKKHVRIEAIGSQKRNGSNFKVTYEPELYFSKLTIKFSDGIVASVFANGTVVAQGRNLTGIEQRVRSVLESYKNPYGSNVKGTPVPARKNLKKKRNTMTEARYNRANTWTNVRNGYYVRPGPNKRPRFYKVPANPALVRTKVLRAYSNIGVNVPNNVKRALGIVTSNKAPKPKVVAKKTLSNWNANVPNGFYIRPGPGGLPKTYKIPKHISQGKKTVIEAYKKIGVNIPKKVKNIFKIVNGSPAVSSAPKLRGEINNKGVFKIDTLECMRYKLEDLKKIATKLDIPISRQTKAQLCKAIQTKLLGSTSSIAPVSENFIKNGVKHYILVNEKRVRRNTKTKAMNSFKIQELKNMILAMNNSSNVNGKKKKNLINMLIERKRTKNELNKMFNLNMSPSPSSSSSSSSASSSSSSGGPRRDPLNIARNMLGGGTNAELRNFLNRYKKSPNKLSNLINEFKSRPRRLLKTNVEEL